MDGNTSKRERGMCIVHCAHGFRMRAYYFADLLATRVHVFLGPVMHIKIAENKAK